MKFRQRRSSKHDLLAKIPLFAACNDSELTHIAGLLDEVEAAPGEVLIREATSGRECFVVVSGTATVSLRGEVFGTVGPGDVIGEMALLVSAPRSATVVADEPMRLLTIDPAGFSELIGRHATVGKKLLVVMARRLRAVQGAPAV